MANQIKFNIGFNVDRSGLNSLKQELLNIQNAAQSRIDLSGTEKARQELQTIITQTKVLEDAFEKSYNFKLGTVDFVKFSANLKASSIDLSQYAASLSKLGIEGPQAFRTLTSSIVQTQTEVKQGSKLLEKMGNTLMNTIRWSIASAAINQVTGSIQKAWGFTKELDSSLNDIVIVTGKSADEMANFAQQANKAAKELKTSTNQYTQAALIYYQQGLGDEEVAARSDVTVKAANVTGQSAQAVSEQLTAIWNGYKVSAQETELYIDKVAAVAASTAADLEELSVGMSRVASAANIMGVDIDQLNAQLATIVSVTREAPESVGTALKTVYARMSDIRAGLDSETTLDEYTKQMAQMGINVLDVQGNLRDMGDVVEEIGNKWNILNRNQQVSLAQTIAGTRQYSRMMSLFDNWDMYNDALKTSQSSMGTLQKQQDEYAKSTEAHLMELKSSSEELYMTLFNSEGINKLIDGLTSIVSLFNNLIEGIGGGSNALLIFTAIATKALSSKMGEGLSRVISNKQIAKRDKAKAVAQQEVFDSIKKKGGFDTSAEATARIQTQNNAEQIELLQIEEQLQEAFGEEEDKLKKRQQEINQRIEERTKLEQKLADPIFAARYDKEVAASKDYHEKEIWFMQNRHKMSEEEQKKWLNALKLQEEALAELHSLNEQDYAERMRLAAEKERIEKEQLAALAKIDQEEVALAKKAADELVAIEQEKEEKIKRIKEQAAQDLARSEAQKELAAAEKEASQLAQEEDSARDIFLRQARTVEGGVFSDKTAFTYREGAQSGGTYISPDKAMSRLEQRDAELGLHSKSIKDLDKDILNLSDEQVDNADAAQEMKDALSAEISLLEKEAQQLDISIERLNEYQRLKKEYDEAIDRGDVDAAKQAGHKITTMAEEDISRNRKENKIARKYLSDATERQDKNQKRQKAAQDKLDKEKIKNAKKTAEELQAVEEEYGEKISKQGKDQAKEQGKLAEKRKSINDAAEKALRENANVAEEVASQVASAENEQTEAINSTAEAMNDDKLKTTYQDFGNTLSNMASSAMMVVSGFTALKNIGNIFNNEDLTTGEKITQVLTTVLTALPMLIGGVTAFGKGIKAIGTQSAPVAIAGMLGLNASQIANIAATSGATAAWGALGSAIWTALAPVLPIILAIVAAVSLITVVVVQSVKAYNAAAENAEKAAKYANEMADAYNRTKQEYENLKAAITDYKDAQAAIDDMIAGTEEWRQAIADANAQVIDLITTYPELAKYMSNQGGRLILSEEGLIAEEEEKRKDSITMQRAALLAKQKSVQADLNLAAVKAQRQASDTFSEADGAQAIANILATSEDAFTSKEAFEQALKGSVFELLADRLWENKDALQSLTEATVAAETESAALRQQLALTYLQENASYKELTKKYASIEKEIAEIERNDYNSNQEYINARLQKQKELDATQSDIDIVTSLSSAKGFQENIRSNYESEVNDEWSNGNAAIREQMVKEYWSSKLGIPTSDIDVKNTGGGNYKVRWRDAESGKMGGWEKNSVDELKSNLTDLRASKHDIKDELDDALDNFRALEDYQEKALESFIGDGKGDFSKLTKKELEKIKESFSFDGLEWEEVKADESKLAELEKYAEALGLETTDEALRTLLQGINTAVDNYELQENKISENFLGRSISSVFKENANAQDAFNKLSLSARTSLSKFYNDLALSTKDGADVASRILSTLTEENADTFMYAFNAVDWTNQESIASYTGLLKEFDSTLTDAELEEYTFQMRYLNGVIEDFNLDAAAAKFLSLQEIINNLNEAGDTISGEQYKTLSSEMQKYFLRMADGTYSLIGSAEAFREAAEAARKAELENALVEAQKKSKADFENATTLTKAEKDKIKVDLDQKRENRENELKAIQAWGWSDLTGDTKGTWFEGNLDKLDTNRAKEIVELAKKYGVAQDSERFKDLETRVSENRVRSDDLEWLIQIKNEATNKALAEAVNINSQDAIEAAEKEALEKKLEEAQAANLNTDNVTISNSEIDAMTQILAEAGSISAVDEYLAKWKEYYQGLELSTEKVEELGKKYLDFYKNAAENFKIEVDPYEELDRSLNQVEKRLNKIEETQDLLYGQAAIDNLKAYNEELANQVDLINQKIELNQEEAQKAKENLEALTYINPDGSKIKFSDMSGVPALEYDNEGNITNWEDYVGAIESYIKENYDADSAKSAVEALNSGRDDYIAELEKGAELVEQKRQTFLTALEKNLEAFELEIQIKIDENEFKQSILDFKTEMGRVIGDTASFDLVKDDIATYMQALNDLDQMTKVESLDGLTEADIAAGNLISKADYEAKKREIINSLMEKGISLKEAVIAMDEQANEKYEKYINFIDSANSALDHQKDLYELIYGDQAFTKMNSYYSQQVANAESVAATRLAQYQQDQEFMANAGTELSEYAQEQYLESAENYFQALNDLAALYQEKYINELKTALDNFDKEISGGLGTQALRDEWDWVAAVAEDSLSKIDAAIGISSLESSFTKAIDAAPSISAQKTLNKLRDEELAKLSAKEKLTQADLDRAQKSLEITQAEIALQEAQMNKSKMRLTRGPDGIYSYQYVADQDAIAEKTDELNKLKQELVEIDENAAKDAADKVYEVYSEMIAKIEELGPDATEEEIYAVMQQYSTRINSLSGIAADALGNLRLSAQSVADAFGIEGSLEEIIPWTNTGWIDTVTSFASNGFENMFSSTWDTIAASLEDYRTKMYGEEGEEGLYSQLEAATTAYLESLNGDEGLIKAQEAELTAVTKLTTAMGDLSNYIESIIQVVDPNYTASDPASYDTGGYTGKWDSSGRLAVLHQKELVLNATDTQKILDAVSLVRSFENSINSALSNRYMEQLALMSARLDLNNLDTQETNIEQTVHITAEFPNVSVKEEIEAAFEDIIDLAAQYAAENKR